MPEVRPPDDESGKATFADTSELAALAGQNEVQGEYERYSGVCDVLSPEQALAMANELREHRKDPDRKVMIGVMAGHFSLRPNVDDPAGQRTVFPAREEMSRGFIDDPDVLNTVHFADLYRPKEVQTLYEDLELVVQYGGEHLHAIQLDVTWPSPDELERFKSEHPELKIILQLGKFAYAEADHDPQKVVESLEQYGTAIDFVLLDMSMGKGKEMDPEGLLPLLRSIRRELPGLGLAVAGGLGPDSMDLLAPIAKEFPDISIDAQGGLKPPDAPVDALGHLVATSPIDIDRSMRYIQQSSAMLDNPRTQP